MALTNMNHIPSRRLAYTSLFLNITFLVIICWLNREKIISPSLAADEQHVSSHRRGLTRSEEFLKNRNEIGYGKDLFASHISSLRMQLMDKMLADTDLLRSEFTHEELEKMFVTYRNTVNLFPTEKRGSGRTFEHHVLGTASCALAVGLSPLNITGIAATDISNLICNSQFYEVFLCHSHGRPWKLSEALVHRG